MHKKYNLVLYLEISSKVIFINLKSARNYKNKKSKKIHK